MTSTNTTNTTHPYTLDVVRSLRNEGRFEWTIRRHGKLIERSDRVHPSEKAAYESGQSALDRQFRGER